MHPAEQLLSFVEEVVGPTRELVPDGVQQRRWEHAATSRGREVRLSLTGRQRLAQSLSLGVSLQQRPVQLWIQLRSVDVVGTELLTEVLPGYPADIAARGAPREVLSRVVLDPGVMHTLARRAGPAPLLYTEDGWLFIQVEPRERGGLPSPAEIASWLDALVELADRLVAAFDDAHRQASERGPAPAAAWLEQQHAAVARRADAGAIVRVVAIAAAIGATMLITLALVSAVAC